MIGKLHSGGLFISRPRSVTLGLGIAGVMGTITLLIGMGIFFSFSKVYVGMTSFIDLSAIDNGRTQGTIVIIFATIFLVSVVRALRPVRIPRFVTIAISGLTGVLFFYCQLPLVVTAQDMLRLFVITALMSAPAILLMSPSANEYYGE